MRKLLILSLVILATIGIAMATNTAQAKKPETHTAHHKRTCSQAKPYIRHKRLATWGWQDQLFKNHTPTTFSERQSSSCKYLKWLGKLWAQRAHSEFEQFVKLKEPKAAICYVFKRYCGQALGVSGCETGNTYDIYAQNGQYLGLFQMGSYERRTFGHGNTPLAQAWAAWRYFDRSGRDWSPWSCRWAAS